MLKIRCNNCGYTDTLDERDGLKGIALSIKGNTVWKKVKSFFINKTFNSGGFACDNCGSINWASIDDRKI